MRVPWWFSWPVLVVVLTLAVMFGLLGCASPAAVHHSTIVDNLVPVPVHRDPPAALLAPVDGGPVPVFVAPTDPAASSALTAEGERRLKEWLLALRERCEAWRAWATAGEARP